MKKTLCLFMVVISLLSFSSCANKNNSTSADNSKSQSGNFKVVQITMENYQEYFEIKERFVVLKDEFGMYDVEGMNYGVYFCLKDEYEVDAGFGKSDVRVKYEYTSSYCGFDFDEKTGEGKIAEFIEKYKDVYESTNTLRDFTHSEVLADLKYGIAIDNKPVSVWPYDEGGWDEEGKYKYTVNYPENINIIGITGNLYVRKK